MKTSEILLWGFLGSFFLATIIISSYFKYEYRTQKLKYIQEHTDDKTFANYLFYRQIFGLISLVIIIGYLGYMAKFNGKI